MIKTFAVKIGGEMQEDKKKILGALDDTINAFLAEPEKKEVSGEIQKKEESGKIQKKIVKHVNTETVIEAGLLIRTITYDLI